MKILISSIKMNILDYVRVLTQFFVLFGSLNWGTYGFFGIDVVKTLFGESSFATTFYGLIAFSGLFMISCKLMLMG